MGECHGSGDEEDVREGSKVSRQASRQARIWGDRMDVTEILQLLKWDFSFLD